MAQANVKAAQAAQVEVNPPRNKAATSASSHPFDGVVTQRNINIGDLVQANAASGTFMFTLMESDIIRTQVYVPQDQAFGLVWPGSQGDRARAGTVPGRTFAGTVTRIADALVPGTRTLLTEVDIPNPDGMLRSRGSHSSSIFA